MTSDEHFMLRAIELAQRGIGHVSPNPLVGCVIVHDNKIIAEGWHKKYGEAHAEVNAVHAVEDVSVLPHCDVFVNLEPCSHFGKTPPCADLLIKHRVKRVVIANSDPNPLVAGNGIKKLKDAGIDVSLGVLQKDGEDLNRRFFTSMTKQRPYVILKWAQTSDGFIAQSDYNSKWITNVYSRQLVHRWRAEEDAILVGGRTAAQDNPQLNVRDWSGRDPVRIVIDPDLGLDQTLNLFDQTQPTLIYNHLKNFSEGHVEYVQIENLDAATILSDLYKRKLQSIIVEGGAKTISLFTTSGLWDEMRVFISDKKFGSGIEAPTKLGELISTERIMDDELHILLNKSAR